MVSFPYQYENQQIHNYTFDDTSNAIRVELVDPYGHNTVAAIDPITAGLAVIQIEHGQIHAGRMFFVDSYIDLPNSQKLDVLFLAPSITDHKEAHLVFEVSFQSEGSFEVYENPTILGNGTPVTSFNRKRASTNNALSSLYTTPSLGDLGTLLISKRVGSGKGNGGDSRSNMELVLCCDRKYLFRMTNQTTSDNLCNYQADWYEVDEFP